MTGLVAVRIPSSATLPSCAPCDLFRELLRALFGFFDIAKEVGAIAILANARVCARRIGRIRPDPAEVSEARRVVVSVSLPALAAGVALPDLASAETLTIARRVRGKIIRDALPGVEAVAALAHLQRVHARQLVRI